jgi:superfamily II DNA/RNA helicase
VTPESAVREEFATFLNRLRATQQLDRIVIDECHIVLNRRYDFRKEMQKLGKLAAAETQIVMLTATLPPSEEDELFRRMYVEREQVELFRAATARTNVAYRVIRVGKAAKKKEVEEMVTKMVRQKLCKHKKGKVVVYSNSVAKVKELAQQLGCHAYHHKAVGKASMLEEFARGKKRVIIATSALGIGVDIPDIRCIIHIDWPFTVLDYAQESGRAGRDGLRSEAVMIVQEGQQRAAEDKQAEVEQQLVRAYVEGMDETVTCRRAVLDGYLDRREEERVGCEEGEEKCDVCRGADSEEEEEVEEEESQGGEGGSSNEEDADTVEAEREEAQQVFNQQQQARRGPRQTLMQQRQQEFADVEWLRRQLAWWTKRCGICEAAGDGQSGHDVRQCWRANSKPAKDMIKAVGEKIRFEEFSGCYWCGVPQEICNRWEDNGRGRYQRAKGGDCPYRGVLIGGLFGLVYGSRDGVVERWVERLVNHGVDGVSIEGLVRHLGRKQVLEWVESNGLVGEFCYPRAVPGISPDPR